MKTRYNDIRFYQKELAEQRRKGLPFFTKETTYTKTICGRDEKTIFNEGGENNKKVVLLLSVVRRDAANFMKTHTIADVRRETDFFNLLDIVPRKEVIVKVDLKSAYWIKALKDGIITQKTDDKFKEWYANIDPKEAKDDRLKALGSLGTTNIITQYDANGRRGKQERFTEATKHIYMYVCDEIDTLMKDVNMSCEGCVYYYWDCMFIVKRFAQDAINYLSSRGYDVGVDETSLEYVPIGNVGYLLSLSDDKIYMTRKENQHALPQLQYEDEEI